MIGSGKRVDIKVIESFCFYACFANIWRYERICAALDSYDFSTFDKADGSEEIEISGDCENMHGKNFTQGKGFL